MSCCGSPSLGKADAERQDFRGAAQDCPVLHQTPWYRCLRDGCRWLRTGLFPRRVADVENVVSPATGGARRPLRFDPDTLQPQQGSLPPARTRQCNRSDRGRRLGRLHGRIQAKFGRVEIACGSRKSKRNSKVVPASIGRRCKVRQPIRNRSRSSTQGDHLLRRGDAGEIAAMRGREVVRGTGFTGKEQTVVDRGGQRLPTIGKAG